MLVPNSRVFLCLNISSLTIDHLFFFVACLSWQIDGSELTGEQETELDTHQKHFTALLDAASATE